MKSFTPKSRALMMAALVLCAPAALRAQDVDADDGGDAAATDSVSGRTASAGRPRTTIRPYIEASQVLLTQLSPQGDTFTYTTLAAGIDASVSRRNTQAAASVRYERRIGWGRNAADSDTISGLARLQTAIVPRAVNFEAGAMAARTSLEGNGSTATGIELGNSTNIYSVYAGPSVSARSGEVAIDGYYRLGYTKVTSPDAFVPASSQDPVDLFDSSTAHNAALHLGTRAGDPLPIGFGAGIGYNREDVSNLDQRVEDFHARGDVAVPVTDSLQLVGGLGWEKVSVSSRDAARDPSTGLPIIGSDGRYVTDRVAPSQIAFESEGLIWDAGVLWRPSRRTAVEAHFGRRYGSSTYYGSAAYAPNARTSISISVYDNLSGLGGAMNRALVALPTQFDAVRNPLTGDLQGCVSSQGPAVSGQGNCLTGAFTSLRSSVFRGRGIMASAKFTAGRIGYGLGAGYDRRRFIAVPGSVLGVTNLTIDENWWVAAYLKGRIDAQSTFGTTVWANWYQSGSAFTGDSNAVGANAYYNRLITERLSATAAVGLTGVNRDDLADIWTAQALAGLRYEF